MRTAACAWSND